MSAHDRKILSDTYLKELGIPVNLYLPPIEPTAETELRNAQEVARRCLVLCAVCGIGHDVDRLATADWLKREQLWNFVSPSELLLIESGILSAQQKIDATWRAESIWTLLWSLGKTDALGLPLALCNIDTILQLVPLLDESTEKFIEAASLVPSSEILCQADLIYRIHWAVRNAQINGCETPGGLVPGVVFERHYTLNWLVSEAEEWDDISTDT